MAHVKNIPSTTGIFRILSLLILTLTLLSGCGSGSESTDRKPPPPPTELDVAGFEALLKNSPRDFVLVNFYATWCGPCKREMPDLVQIARDSSSQAEVILISIDAPGDVSKIPGFLQDYGIDFATYTKVNDSGKLIARYYPGWQGSIPLTLLFRKGGEMLEAIVGMTSGSELQMILNRYSKIGEM